MKERFIKLLKGTGRPECDRIVTNLDKLGFFDAPASTRFHLSEKGGLVRHSLNVCDMALSTRETLIKAEPSLADKLPEGSVIFVSLLHDICKAEVYKTVQKWRKDDNGRWESYNAYETDYSHFPAGHGEKSVFRLLAWGVRLSQDEVLAIRWHMSAWDLPFQSHEEMSNLTAARDKCPLLTLLQAADMLASGVIETKEE